APGRDPCDRGRCRQPGHQGDCYLARLPHVRGPRSGVHPVLRRLIAGWTRKDRDQALGGVTLTVLTSFIWAKAIVTKPGAIQKDRRSHRASLSFRNGPVSMV